MQRIREKRFPRKGTPIGYQKTNGHPRVHIQITLYGLIRLYLCIKDIDIFKINERRNVRDI